MRGSRGGVGRGGGPDLPRTINISSIYIVELAKIYIGPPPPGKHKYHSNPALENNSGSVHAYYTSIPQKYRH